MLTRELKPGAVALFLFGSSILLTGCPEGLQLPAEVVFELEEPWVYDAPYPLDVRQASDGGFILAGAPYELEQDASYLLRTDAEGDVRWTFTGTSHHRARTVCQTSDGGFCAAGEGFIDDEQGIAVYVLKCNDNGGQLWSNTYNVYEQENVEQAINVRPTADGGCLVAARSSYGGTSMLRIGGDGELLWFRPLTSSGSEVDFGEIGSAETADGGFVIARHGHITGNATAPSLLKASADGDLQWRRLYPNLNGTYEHIRGVAEAADGGYFLVTQKCVQILLYTPIPLNTILRKIDGDGDLIWEKIYGTGRYVGVHKICPAPDGGCLLTTTAGKAMKIDQSGTPLWVNQYQFEGENLFLPSIRQTSDGGYVLAGRKYYPGSGLSDMLVALIDANGTPLE